MAEESVADDHLAAFVDRILRMKGEEDAIKSDIKEIYAEAKGMGYDKTRLGDVVSHVRKHEKDAAGEAEKEAIRDLYLTAYYRAKNKPHTHAPARAAKVTTENTSVPAGFDAETGEEVTTPIQPETANEETPSVEGINAPLMVAADANTGGLNDLTEDRSDTVETLDDRADDQALGSDVETVAPSNVSTLRQPAPLRPNCLNRDKCGGQGRNHCWSCQKAMNERASA